MPDFKDLVIHLAGIHITDRNRRRAYEVAGHLVESALKEHWHSLSARHRQTLIRESGDRLWTSYMDRRRNDEINPKEAAQEAIFDEESTLERLINPNTNPIRLSQLDDF